MARKWVARPYRYADGVPWNSDRYEIFVEHDGQWVSVGGAIRSWNLHTVVFLCPKSLQRFIRTPEDARNRTEGLYLEAPTVKRALELFQEHWPSPVETLAELTYYQDFAFNQIIPASKKPVVSVKTGQSGAMAVNSPTREG